MKILNLISNLAVYTVFCWLTMKLSDFLLELVLNQSVNDKISFYIGLIATAVLITATANRAYRLVKPDTIELFHFPFGNKGGRTNFICHFTGFNFVNIFAIYDGEISLKNTIGNVEKFQIETKTSHVFLELLFDWEPDPENISTLIRNASSFDDIVEDVNQKIKFILKSVVEAKLSDKSSAELVISANNTFDTLHEELEKIFVTNEGDKNESTRLGIKPPIVRPGDIDLSVEESRSRVVKVTMETYKKEAQKLARCKGINLNQALKIILASDGKAEVSDKSLHITGSGENVTIVAPGGTI